MFGKGVSLVVGIVGDTTGLQKSLGDAGVDVKDFGSSALGTAAKVSVVAGAAVAAGAAIFEMADAAAADRAEQDKLTAAIKAAGAETANTTAQVEAAIAAGQAKAFSDTETREALQSLVTATGDVGAATNLLTDAQNIARFAGVDLATAADAVAKANAGQDGALRKLLPGLEKGADATDTLAAASKQAAGQADLFAESTDGMKARAGDAFGELTETIGSVFLPILDAIIPALIPILQAFGELVEAILPVLIPLVKLLSKALTVAFGIITKVLGALKGLVEWAKKLLKPLGDVINKLEAINPFRGMSFPSFGAATSGVSGLQAESRAGGQNAVGPVTINIYGDPAVIEAKVIKALRGYQSRNGVGSVFSPGRS
jgi:hypothetical protein